MWILVEVFVKVQRSGAFPFKARVSRLAEITPDMWCQLMNILTLRCFVPGPLCALPRGFALKWEEKANQGLLASSCVSQKAAKIAFPLGKVTEGKCLILSPRNSLQFVLHVCQVFYFLKSSQKSLFCCVIPL